MGLSLQKMQKAKTDTDRQKMRGRHSFTRSRLVGRAQRYRAWRAQ
jgi:hypothetical protein